MKVMAEIEITLPDAPPDEYLRWMAFWREVERRMVESPRLAEVAGAESAPFLHDPTADYLSGTVVPEIARQARDAQKAGEELVAPRLVVDGGKLAAGLRYILRRGSWLEQRGVPEAMGMEPLSPELTRLRSSVLGRVRAQLAEHDISVRIS